MVKKVIHKIKEKKLIKKETVEQSSIVFMASIGPIMTVPQAFQIWVLKRSAGICIPTWAAYFLVSLAWIAYSLKKKDKPLFFNALANAVLNLIIVSGAFFVHS